MYSVYLYVYQYVQITNQISHELKGNVHVHSIYIFTVHTLYLLLLLWTLHLVEISLLFHGFPLHPTTVNTFKMLKYLMLNKLFFLHKLLNLANTNDTRFKVLCNPSLWTIPGLYSSPAMIQNNTEHIHVLCTRWNKFEIQL